MVDRIIDRILNDRFVLIAEAGVNYYDIAQKDNIPVIEAAKKMISEAAKAGCHAIKFQTYKAEKLAAKESPSYWDTSEEKETSQYMLFKKFDSFGCNEYETLKKYSDECGIEFLSTPFDVDAVDYLDSMLNVYKISSSDLNNVPFVRYIAQKNKPIILSVGASNIDEIRGTVELIRQYNDKPLVLLHCVLEYPTPYEHANLLKIKSLAEEFSNLKVGYSDHTKLDGDFDVLKIAYLLGAKVIEKHFTLDKTLAGNDHYHAMDSNDIRKILEDIGKIETLLGSGELKCLDSEYTARKNARRSVVSNGIIPKGSVITKEMITFKRPGTGIEAKYYDDVIGKTAICDINDDVLIEWKMLK